MLITTKHSDKTFDPAAPKDRLVLYTNAVTKRIADTVRPANFRRGLRGDWEEMPAASLRVPHVSPAIWSESYQQVRDNAPRDHTVRPI